MTREELIRAIYKSDENWSCPHDPCGNPDIEDGTHCCFACAEKQLSEYEQRLIKTSVPAEVLIGIGELLKNALDTVTVYLDRALEMQEEGRSNEHSTTD